MSVDIDHEKKRGRVRRLGLALGALGAAMLVAGLADLLANVCGQVHPRLFWLAILGVPLVMAGGALLAFGFLGAISRYSAAEVSPAARDAIDVTARGVMDTLRAAARAAAESAAAGVSAARQSAGGLACPKCQRMAPAQARFCAECGSVLITSKPCPRCRSLNEAEAKFCGHCGAALGGDARP